MQPASSKASPKVPLLGKRDRAGSKDCKGYSFNFSNKIIAYCHLPRIMFRANASKSTTAIQRIWQKSLEATFHGVYTCV